MSVPTPWVRCFRRRPAASTILLCFPHAGGAASAYRDWPAHLPADVELWAVQYPGREDRIAEPLIDTMAELVDAVVKAVEPALDRPVVVFGHSMGASVAHEFTLRLRPGVARRLVVSARPGPADQRPRADLVHLRDEAGVRAELDLLGGGGAAAMADPQLRDLLLPMIGNDFALIERYRPGPAVLGVDVLAHVGADDPSMPPESADSWAAATTGSFTRHTHPGGHFYLADRLADVIATLGGSTPEVNHMSEAFTVEGLREAVAEVLGVSPDPDANLFELGLDSMRMMMLSVRWQAHGVEVPFADLAEQPTLSAWSKLLTAG
ncbi:alpha/beta fold hydrolase [Actinokineospora iranica]|uniref:Pyochelin biosynthetic protein PchC n=1 Tax=Actinokineospora iranica TaxID=1271860 RepID=A0A1G6TA30_9PSEU|nr:alpha/beta fold hydrolase [Actinokineospora iranica]SDD25426.1 pyochelin biosynthetic protein PchC [Actinokineospora iranica]